MYPSMQKQSGLMRTSLPMKPSILATSIKSPVVKVKEQIRKAMETYKAK